MFDALNVWSFSQVRPPFEKHSIQVLCCMSMQFYLHGAIKCMLVQDHYLHLSIRLQKLNKSYITGVDSLRYFSTFSHSVTYLSSRFVPAVVATINAIMAGTNNLGSLLYVCNHPFETYLIHCIRSSVIQQSFFQHKHSSLLAYSPFLVCCSSNRIHT